MKILLLCFLVGFNICAQESKVEESDDWRKGIRLDLFKKRIPEIIQSEKRTSLLETYLVQKVMFLEERNRAIVIHVQKDTIHYIKVGDFIEDWRVIDINQNGVQVFRDEKRVHLKWDERFQ